MGVKVAPDIAQETIKSVLGDIDCEKDINNVGSFSNNWSGHIQFLDIILSRLDSAEFTINPLKEMRMGSQRNRLPWLLVNIG